MQGEGGEVISGSDVEDASEVSSGSEEEDDDESASETSDGDGGNFEKLKEGEHEAAAALA